MANFGIGTLAASYPSAGHWKRSARRVQGLDLCFRAGYGESVQTQLFLPNPRATNWLLIVGFLSLGQALYLRYLGLENSQVALACQGGLDTWLCATLRLATSLFRHSAFGWCAVVCALLNLVRPSIVLLSLSLAASALGLVLYNAGLSGLAVALLILSLARPAPAAE